MRVFVLGIPIAGVVCEAVYRMTSISSNRTRFVDMMLKTMMFKNQIRKITQIFDQIYHFYLRGRYKSRLLKY